MPRREVSEEDRAFRETAIPRLESELNNLSEMHGLSLSRREVELILNNAIERSRGSESELSESLQRELLEHYRQRDPETAELIYRSSEGRRYWDGLQASRATVTIGGQEVTLESALRDCRMLEGEERAERFRDIISQVAERFRFTGEENGFGLHYDTRSTDPAEALSHGTFNCFSGSIILGHLISHAAEEAGMREEVWIRVQQVASFTLGSGWDDGGHAMLRVDLLGMSDDRRRVMFFDSANTIVPNHADSFRFNPQTNTVDPAVIGTVHYRLGETIPIGRELDEIARFQDRLFDMDRIDASARSRISSMPPLFMSYFINTMSQDEQRRFFSQLGMRAISRIESPALRYRIAATAAEAFSGTNEKLALAFSSLALRSVGEAIGNPDERRRLPMGAFLETTLNLVERMHGTRAGDELIVSSGVWQYLSYISANSTAEISSEQAGRTRDFLVEFYQGHPEVFRRIASRYPSTIISFCQGVLSLTNLSESTSASDDALDGLYRSIGINREELLSRLRENARATPDVPQETIENILSMTNIDQILERNFLNICNEIVVESFSKQSLRLRASGAQGGNRVIARSIYLTFTGGQLSGVLLARGPMRRAAERVGLI